jgi:predicted membrane metal-binding protein
LSTLPHSAGLHERLDRSGELETSSDRGFGLTFAIVGAIVALWPLLEGGPPRWWLLLAVAGLVAISLAAPHRLRPFNRVWTRLGLLLNRLVSPVVLGAIFFGVITPFGMALRALGKDPLRLRVDAAAASYWIERRPPGPAPGSMTRQF